MRKKHYRYRINTHLCGNHKFILRCIQKSVPWSGTDRRTSAGADMNYDLNAWLETYKDTFTTFARAQQDGFKALERLARFHYAVAGDVLEAGLAQTKAAVSARAAGGTELIADLLQKQAEIGTQLSEKL